MRYSGFRLAWEGLTGNAGWARAWRDPAPKPEAKKGDAKGQLPQYWKQLGLSDAQKAQVYRVTGRYAAEIDKLEAQIVELKAKRDRERRDVLTPDQKKRLEAIIKEKAGADK